MADTMTTAAAAIFSGRITAPLTFAGSIARQVLSAKGIHIGAHVTRIAEIEDRRFDPLGESEATFASLREEKLPVLTKDIGEQMEAAILAAKAEGDSVGGIVECMVTGLPVGLGDPFFDSLESELSHMTFSIPAVKGIEFGDGFGLAAMKGSAANDGMHWAEGKVETKTNHNGGIWAACLRRQSRDSSASPSSRPPRSENLSSP